MIKPVNTPAYLDKKYSGLKDVQVETINTIVRTMYNRFIGKVNQEELEDTPTTVNSELASWRVTNLKDYNYAGVSSMSFDFDTKDMIRGNEYKIFSLSPTSFNSSYLSQSGLSNLDSGSEVIENNKSLLSYYGSFYLQLIPQSNEFSIIFRAINGKSPDDPVLPSTNWQVTLGYYSRG